MEIRETLFSKTIQIDNEDPYGLSLDFMRKMSDIGRIYERKNSYETDGPVKKATVVFDLVESLDTCSRIIINFALEAENNKLYVSILAEFVLKIKDYGFFTEVFTDFYLQNVFPVLRKVSQKRAEELNKQLGK